MKVIMVLASNGFRDPEFFVPKEILEKSGIKVATACSKETALGAEGANVKADFLLNNINPAEFDAVIFIGGPGTSEYFNNPIAHEISRKTISSGKLLCAICISPVILANAGILKNKKATVFPSGIPDLQRNGAIVSDKGVEIDGNIITANDKKVSKQFGEAIVNLLCRPRGGGGQPCNNNGFPPSRE